MILNVMLYDVRKKRGYISLLSAIGYKKKIINKLYLVELSIVFGISLIISFVFGSIFSIAVGNYINHYIFDSQENNILYLSLNYYHFIFSFILISFILIITVGLISLVINKYSKKINVIEELNSQ